MFLVQQGWIPLVKFFGKIPSSQKVYVCFAIYLLACRDFPGICYIVGTYLLLGDQWLVPMMRSYLLEFAVRFSTKVRIVINLGLGHWLDRIRHSNRAVSSEDGATESNILPGARGCMLPSPGQVQSLPAGSLAHPPESLEQH